MTLSRYLCCTFRGGVPSFTLIVPLLVLELGSWKALYETARDLSLLSLPIFAQNLHLLKFHSLLSLVA